MTLCVMLLTLFMLPVRSTGGPLTLSPQQQLDLVLGRLEANRGGIVLFHDTKVQTAAMLPPFLRALKSRGYRIVHVVPAPPR